jgi:prepilin-type N-terminal cleavage/methylation domain-containing protein
MFKFIEKKISFRFNIRPAFTLIEMVVSISIITIMAALFIVNYRSANKRTDLTMAAQNLVADLHLAQNNALGLVKYNNAVPPDGWGISFATSTNSYTLFADLDKPGDPDYLKYDPITEGIVNYGARTTYLPAEISIDGLDTSGGSQPNNRVNVTFLPPDPVTNIYRVDVDGTSTVLEIKLKEARNNSTKTIRVNFLGLAEVVD